MFPTGHKISLINLSIPLAKRRRPNCWRYVPPPRGTSRSEGVGFYFASRGLTIGDAPFDLRVSEANDHLGPSSRKGYISGYCADEHEDTVIRPYVLALPHGRGFLPAYGEGPGMWGAVDYDIYETVEEAAYAAHDAAERAAEREREYREEEAERMRQEEQEADQFSG